VGKVEERRKSMKTMWIAKEHMMNTNGNQGGRSKGKPDNREKREIERTQGV